MSNSRPITFGSLFSGAGGFEIGFERAGMQCEFQCEIDRTANEVLRYRWPGIPKHKDVTKLRRKHLPEVDVLVGGFPCQDLSVAGNRGGLAGERSGLFYELARITRELRPKFLVWENVGGLLSSDDGRDFARVIRHLGDSGYSGCWRLLCSQYFGVPHQRRRVFGVFARRDIGVECCSQILALAEGVRGDTPKGRGTGEVVAAITANGVGTCGAEDSQAQNGHIVYRELGEGHQTYQEAEVTGSLRTGSGGGALKANLVVYGGGDTRGERRGNATLSSQNQRNDFDTENFVMCVPIDMRQASRGEKMTNNRKPGSSGGAPGTGIGEAGDPSPTLGLSRQPAVALLYQAMPIQDGRGLVKEQNGFGVMESGPSYTLDATGGQSVFMFQERGREGGRSLGIRQDGLANTLTAPNGGGRSQERNIYDGGTVRRLTQRECERLQGWPDDHTLYGDNGCEIADGPRYKMIGNGVTSTVANWIARRIVKFSP